MKETYYCVTSTQKNTSDGEMKTWVNGPVRCPDAQPKGRYFRKLELWVDYFSTKKEAEDFAQMLMR